MGMPIIKPSDITREQSVGDIIESIAMEESAIAHILNAESEKLNKVISDPSATPQQLMATNKSIKNTVDAIIRMESVLQSKLNLFESMICQ
ncbi:MAG: hypothetical protein RSE91_04990 [Bacilli bacterium]